MLDHMSDFKKIYFQSRLSLDPRRTVLWKTLWDCYFRFLIHEDETVLDLGAGYCDFINNVRVRNRFAVDQWLGIKKYAAPGVHAHVVGDRFDCAGFYFSAAAKAPARTVD